MDCTPMENKYHQYLLIDLLILILSILIPLGLISLNQTAACTHHFEEGGGFLWILGRALGFATFIWVSFTLFKGTQTKKLAKKFESYPKAKDYHCFSALTTNLIFAVHVLVLLNSDPWGPLIFEGEYNHIPLGLFITKLWTGIIFGAIMVAVTVLFFYLRDKERFKKFGYKRFIRVHHIMLIFTLVLAVHIFLINTEVIVILWG